MVMIIRAAVCKAKGQGDGGEDPSTITRTENVFITCEMVEWMIVILISLTKNRYFRKESGNPSNGS